RSSMLSMSETGNVLSRPTRIPTFFIAQMSFQTVWGPESGVRSQTAVSESFVLTPDSRLTTPDFLPVYENSGLYMLASGVVNAGGGHPRKGFWHQLFWTSGGPPPAGTRAEGMCYNPPTYSPAGLSSAGRKPEAPAARYQVENGEHLSVTTLLRVRPGGVTDRRGGASDARAERGRAEAERRRAEEAAGGREEGPGGEVRPEQPVLRAGGRAGRLRLRLARRAGADTPHRRRA